MSKTVRLAVDAMGGDHGPCVTVPACLEALEAHPELHLILVGNKSVIAGYMQSVKPEILKRLEIRHTTEQVEMDESPGNALRNKKDSSMRVSIEMVEQGKAGACVSAGNTGALMVIARMILKTLPGIDRPAIVYSLPTKNPQGEFGHLRMLDLGANVDTTARNLYEFAVMGSILAQAADNIESPKVGLLNIGSEAIKGSEVIKDTAKMLEESKSLNYSGFVEGTDIFQHTCDVVVCDGFVGNVALKSSEGVANMLLGLIKESFSRNIFTKIAALIAKPVIKGALKNMDPKKYNGATLLGLNGLVIKSHGNAQKESFRVAIEEAYTEVKQNVVEKIKAELCHYLDERKTA